MKLIDTPMEFSGKIGIARCDITPQAGISARNWGAAVHDVAEGIHRPLTATAMTVQEDENTSPLVIIGVDLGWFKNPDDAERLLKPLIDALALDSERVMIALSHTHSGPSICLEEQNLEGGELIASYMDFVANSLIQSTRSALTNASSATLTFATGCCNLARNRDLPHPDGSESWIVAYHIDAPADSTLLVGRVTRNSDKRIMATIVNYACHPTTLGSKNRLISPDYIGAMRELIESNTGGAPCLFVQGASGELAPAQQHRNDLSATDRQGRQLGYAVMSVLESMLPPAERLEFANTIESAAALGVFEPVSFQPPTEVSANMIQVDFPLKRGLPSTREIADQLKSCKDNAIKEQLHRKLCLRQAFGDGISASRNVWIWRLGRIVFVGYAEEAYSRLQTTLRQIFPNLAIVVMNLVNGSSGYLTPADYHDRDLYAVWQSPFDCSSFELLIAACRDQIHRLVEEGQCDLHPNLTR